MAPSTLRATFEPRRIRMWVTLILATIGPAGCGGGGSDPNTGAISVDHAEAPVDSATGVAVAFAGISLQRGDATTVGADR